MELVIVTVYDCWGQLNCRLPTSSGCTDRVEWQELWVPFTPLPVHTAHSASGSLVDTSTVKPLFGCTVSKLSDETDVNIKFK